MPLFRVYGDIYDDIAAGRKTIEVRAWLKHGDTATFLSGTRVLRRKIVRVVPFHLGDGFFETNWKRIIPSAENEEAARAKLESIFPHSKEFYAYYIG